MVRELLSDSSWNVAGQYRYDVFGQPNTTSALGNRFMFTGREYDKQWGIGLYYYRARYYKPSIGRFLQTDPTKYGDGMNMYSYVHNNAINVKDPMGLDSPGCNFPGGDWGNHCMRRCCAKHDECYHIGDGKGKSCTAGSWCPFSPRPECKKCNDDVVKCVLTHLICDWKDTPEDYFGRKCGGKDYGYGGRKGKDGDGPCVH